MIWVGAKTCFSIVLVLVAVPIVWFGGFLNIEKLMPLSYWVMFLAGMLAVIAGTAVHQFWSVGERSAFYFAVIARRLRWGTEQELDDIRMEELIVGEPTMLELPSWVHRSVYMAVALLIFLVPLDNQAIAQLERFPKTLSQSDKEFCPDEEELAAKAKAAAEPKLGCELVFRAYRLGYTKDLGDCAPEEDEEIAEICDLRQRDEPYLHYAWRLLMKKENVVTEAPTIDEMSAQFEKQWEASESMAKELMASTAGSKRSSHHLFTNLPEPDGATGSGPGCLERFYAMPYVAATEGEARPSQALEHVVGQLLFNPHYRPVVGACREFEIHWESPNDACQQLVRKGEEFLDDVGIDDDLADILERRRRQLAIREVSQTAKKSEPPGPDFVASFQCLMVDPGHASPAAEQTFTFRGELLPVRSVVLDSVGYGPNGQMALAKAVAFLVAPGFGYGALTSNQAAPLEQDDGKTEVLLATSQFLFSKLELLRDTDLFLGHHWLGERLDLLAVYPYHLHLSNFVEKFRKHYKGLRGRL